MITDVLPLAALTSLQVLYIEKTRVNNTSKLNHIETLCIYP